MSVENTINLDLKLCECGCGETTTFYRGRFRKYLKGHCNRGKDHSGNKEGNWKGGKYKHMSGYILIKKPDHPYCNKNGYVYAHRLIYEHYLKIIFDEDVYIPVDWDIDHINHIRDQNNLINLNGFI